MNEPTRQIYWNITHVRVMYALLFPTLVVAGFGFYRHINRWRRGLPLARFDRPVERFRLLLNHALAQKRTSRDAYAGIFHRLIVYTFLVLLAATTIVALDADFGTAIMRGRFYLYFQSVFVDVSGALLMLGVVLAVIRRHLFRPKTLVFSTESTVILLLLFVIGATGFLLEGWRIAVTHDVWGKWSPVGALVAHFVGSRMTVQAMKSAHLVTWWIHMALCFGFIAWIPYSKMIHLLTAPLNIYTANLAPIGGSLKDVDFEQSDVFGVNSAARFTWKDLLDFDTCTECGRCTSVCPANAVGKELSPRDLILQLREFVREGRGDVFGSPANGTARAALPIIGAVPATSPAVLWQCTTCAACLEVCPVFIEQMPKIVDMRRYLAMEEAAFPATIQDAMASLESRGHPFRGTQATRLDWTEGLNLPIASETKDFEVLFWVGCSGALIERNQKTTRATAHLLQQAGVRFAILGREEKCCGDPARRVGNEFLFDTLAKDVAATLRRYQVKQLVTACPHCFNTFRNEYSRHGAAFQVYHHSQFLSRLIEERRLAPLSKLAQKITFHDPCYLGRHNSVYEAPRDIVRITAAKDPREMTRNRANSFCCGGGGGMSFIDEPADKRVNQERAREALTTGADLVAVACPFCMTMLEDGLNAVRAERNTRVKDIAELLFEATDPKDRGHRPVMMDLCETNARDVRRC